MAAIAKVMVVELEAGVDDSVIVLVEMLEGWILLMRGLVVVLDGRIVELLG